MRMHKRIKRKGFLLIFSLGIFIILSIFCLGLGFRTSLEIRKVRLFLNKTRSLHLALSGIKLARMILSEDNPKVDHLNEEWALLAKADKEESDEQGKVEFSFPRKNGKFTVFIMDESSRINLNMLEHPNQPKAFVRRNLSIVFEEQGLDDFEKKINYIRDYIDQDDLACAADLFFSEEKTKNLPLAVPEEVLLVKNFSKADYNKTKDFLTIIGDEKININTVNSELLDVLIEDEGIKEMVFKVRFGPNGIEGDDDDEYYGEGSNPLPLVLAGRFKTFSNFFRIVSEGEIGGARKKISCILSRKENTIAYWYEE